jgi:hypothetical protein
MEMERELDEEEELFNVEAPLAAGSYTWGDKYRPRKPRYFNRVHTGYEWNKYNQTHYDTDNPPPKVVQGYKVRAARLWVCAKALMAAVQYFLPGPHRQDQGADVQDRQGARERRDRAAVFHGRSAVRGHCVPHRESRVGVLAQAVSFCVLSAVATR